MPQYYSLIKVKYFTKGNINAHVKCFESLEEAQNFPGSEIVIVKKCLPARTAPNSNFEYWNVYSYSIYDSNGQPHFLKYKKAKLSDYILETERSGYNDDLGRGTVSIFDRDKVLNKVRILGQYDEAIRFVENVFDFLIEFSEEYSSDWQYYSEKQQLQKKIEELESEVSELREKISEFDT